MLVRVLIRLPHWNGLVISMAASHVVGHGFAPQSGHTKDHHKNYRHQVRSLTLQHDCVKNWVVCGIVYGDMHYKDFLESIVREGYCIAVQDLYLVLHGLCC